MTKLELSVYRPSADLRLADACAAVADRPAVGLLYTPNRCVFARFADGQLRDADDRPLDLGQVFEARLFDTDWELRWLRDPEQSGTGRVVLLGADGGAAPAGWTHTTLAGLEALDNHYLLWGQWCETRADGRTPAPGWVVLAQSRVGQLLVPFAGTLGPGQGLRLQTLEYLGPMPGESGGDDPNGNWIVRAERLYGIEAYSTGQDRGEQAS